MEIENEKDNFTKPMLTVRCFSHEELQVIKTDCFHILESVDLSKEQRDIRDSIIDKIERELQVSKKHGMNMKCFLSQSQTIFVK